MKRIYINTTGVLSHFSNKKLNLPMVVIEIEFFVCYYISEQYINSIQTIFPRAKL